MKTIDSEVTNFHKKMAKSMHTLLKAFTEGFEAMDRAKMEEEEQARIERTQLELARKQKLEKLNSGIQSLQQMSSNLKQSFGETVDIENHAAAEPISQNLNLGSKQYQSFA